MDKVHKLVILSVIYYRRNALDCTGNLQFRVANLLYFHYKNTDILQSLGAPSISTVFFEYFLLLVIDGTPKDCNNRRNRMQPSKIKKKTYTLPGFLKRLRTENRGLCVNNKQVIVASGKQFLLRRLDITEDFIGSFQDRSK
jgi:hypothetical protein